MVASRFNFYECLFLDSNCQLVITLCLFIYMHGGYLFTDTYRQPLRHLFTTLNTIKIAKTSCTTKQIDLQVFFVTTAALLCQRVIIIY